MPSVEFVISIFLPLSLFVMMLGLGASISFSALKPTKNLMKSLLVGASGQMILLPAVAFAVAIFFDLPSHLAIGLVIISAAPGGVVSNIVSFSSGGNTALSVMLTVVATIASFITIPIVVGLGLSTFADAGDPIDLPVVSMAGQLFFMTILPVSIGVTIKAKLPKRADEIERFADKASIPFLVIVLAVVFASGAEYLITYLGDIITSMIAFILSLGALAYAISKLAGLSFRDTKTVMIEVMLQNTTLGLLVSLTILGREDYSIVPASYGFLMLFITGFVIYGLDKWAGRRAEILDPGQVLDDDQ